MKTSQEKVDNLVDNDEIYERAVDILLSGGIVAFPTETVYGLGAIATDEQAVKKIFEAKGRPSDNPLIVHIGTKEEVDKYAVDIPEAANKLMDACWPGPLTLVLPVRAEAGLAAAAILAVRPDAVVTYAADGGYGHPDHVRTHQLVMAALGLAARGRAGAPGWAVPHVFAIVSDRPERPLEAGVPRIAVAGDKVAKTAAMRAHRTQVTVEGDRYALSDGVWKDISGVEEYVELAPPVSGAR